MQQSERCDGSPHGVWGEMLPESRGRVSTESAWPRWSCGAVCGARLMAEQRDCPSWDPSVGISSPNKPTHALTASARAPEHTRTNTQPCTHSPAHTAVHTQPCAQTPLAHTHRSQHVPAVPPARAGPSLGAGISIPLGSGHCTAFSDSLETVTGAQVRSIKQRAAARAGDSNNKSCSVQWLKLVFKKCPEKKLTPPKTRVGPISANNQQD